MLVLDLVVECELSPNSLNSLPVCKRGLASWDTGGASCGHGSRYPEDTYFSLTYFYFTTVTLFSKTFSYYLSMCLNLHGRG